MHLYLSSIPAEGATGVPRSSHPVNGAGQLVNSTSDRPQRLLFTFQDPALPGSGSVDLEGAGVSAQIEPMITGPGFRYDHVPVSGRLGWGPGTNLCHTVTKSEMFRFQAEQGREPRFPGCSPPCLPGWCAPPRSALFLSQRLCFLFLVIHHSFSFPCNPTSRKKE